MLSRYTRIPTSGKTSRTGPERRGIDHEEEKSVGGQFGRPSGARFRTYERLKRYAEEIKGTLFESQELLKAIDDIYRYPLRQSAIDTSIANCEAAFLMKPLQRWLSHCVKKDGFALSMKKSRYRNRGSSAHWAWWEIKVCRLMLIRTRQHLKDFNFKNLFIEELGWDHCSNQIDVTLDNTFSLTAVAEKHGMVAFICSPSTDGRIPDYSLRRKIERQAAKSAHEHIIIYTDNDKTSQIWQWVKRETGKPTPAVNIPII